MNRLFPFALAIGLPFGLLTSKAYSAEDSETVIEAPAFGALPDDGKDDFDGIRAALAACEGKPRPRLVLAPGVYVFSEGKLGRFKRVFEATGMDDLTIDGQGATLVFSGHTNPFFFAKCRRLTLRNFKIDWDRMPFSQGKVVAATEQSMDVKVEDEYPVTGRERYQGVTDYDPETRLPLANVEAYHPSAIESVKLLGPQLLRVTLRKQVEPEKEAHKNKYLMASVGKLVVLRHEIYGNFAIDLLRCEDVNLENVSIYTCPGMGIHASMSKNITSDHVEVRIKPGSGRLMSTTADCQFYIFCSGTIAIRDGFYEGMGDDGLCVAQKYRMVKKVLSPTSILAVLPVAGWPGALPAPGEMLNFINGADMVPKGAATVRAARWDEQEKGFVIEFDKPLSGVSEKDLLYSGSYMPKLVISKSTFQGMRARGAIFSTGDVRITDCTFRGMGYPGILLNGGLRHGAEGPAPSDVEIRNCRFEGCGGAAIYAYADNVDMPAGTLNQIVIEGNTIRDIPSLTAQRFVKDHPEWVHWTSGICLLSVKDGRIANNVIEGRSSAIYLRNDADIVIEGNRATPPAPVIVDEATCKEITFGGTNDGLKRQTATAEIKPDLQYVNDLH